MNLKLLSTVAFALWLGVYPQLFAEDGLDLMNKLQGGETEFVENQSPFSQWHYGQISGLSGSALTPAKGASIMGRSGFGSRARGSDILDVGTNEAGFDLDEDVLADSSESTLVPNGDLQDGKPSIEKIESNVEKIEIQWDEGSSAPTFSVTVRAPFRLSELVNALRQTGRFEVDMREESQPKLNELFNLKFYRASPETFFKWISARTGQPVDIRDNVITI